MKILRFLIGLGILCAGILVSMLLVKTRPEAKRESVERPPVEVKVAPIRLIDVPVTLPTQGLVDARRRATLAAEVSGKVIEVSEKYESGLEFQKGEVLLEIDPADYEAELARAEASLADARLARELEKARQEQALKDWKALGRSGEPSPLTIREPQLASAEAAITAAEAAVSKAKRDVARTRIVAPFSGRIARTEVELGAYLTPGTPVAEIFTAAPWEIRLPLPLDEWDLLRRDADGEVAGEIAFSAKIGAEMVAFTGRVLRIEAEVERDSRSFHLVGEIPGEVADGLLRPGLFVEAEIAGRTLSQVARVPIRAFVDRDQVAVVDRAKKQITKRRVKVERRVGDHVLISGGLSEGEWVSVTQLADLVEGMTVEPSLSGEEEDAKIEANLSTTKP